MADYTRCSLFYSGAAIFITGITLLLRTEGVCEKNDWHDAISRGTAKSYREFVGKWRAGRYAAVASAEWEKALKREYELLDWGSPRAVEDFVREHPEFQADDIRREQYDAVRKSGSYDVLKRYLETLPKIDPRHDEIEKCMDSAVMSEVEPALKNDDYQELRRLSKKYSDWRGCHEWIDGRIAAALNNSAKAEWPRLADSKSEQELRLFIQKYSGTLYAEVASKRIDALYDDFDYVKSKGTLKAYLDFADNHPDSPRAYEAWQYVANEIEDYVFKRKTLGANESLVKSTLARYGKERPYSGALYGTGGYYSSPLRIITPSYGGDDYFVKLVNRSSGKSVGIYVRSGATVEVSVPDGTYSVRYTTGSQWHGSRFLFGLNAQYSKAARDFTFRDGDGYTLTLQKVVNGNLHTSSMSASDF